MENVEHMGISVDEHNHVVINFGAHVDWIGLSRDDALRLAEIITDYANTIVVREAG